MPNMNGDEAARRIRALGEPIGLIPIVAVSAHSSESVEAMDEAFNMRMLKPIKLEQLKSALMTYLPRLQRS